MRKNLKKKYRNNEFLYKVVIEFDVNSQRNLHTYQYRGNLHTHQCYSQACVLLLIGVMVGV